MSYEVKLDNYSGIYTALCFKYKYSRKGWRTIFNGGIDGQCSHCGHKCFGDMYLTDNHDWEPKDYEWIDIVELKNILNMLKELMAYAKVT